MLYELLFTPLIKFIAITAIKLGINVTNEIENDKINNFSCWQRNKDEIR